MTLENKCRLHWKRLGITNTQALKAYIQSIFSKHDHQKFVMADLYKLVLPDWEKIKKIEGCPEAGRELSIFISKQFIPASLNRDSPAKEVARTKEQKKIYMDQNSKLSAHNLVNRKEVN